MWNAQSAAYPSSTYQPTEMRATSFQDSQMPWSAINSTLFQWMRDPSEIVSEDGEAPTKTTIRLALQLAISRAQAGDTEPIAVVHDGNGGITFEWRAGTYSRWIEISARGNIEEIIIRNGRLRSRKTLSETGAIATS
jgi:hypothetical protein